VIDSLTRRVRQLEDDLMRQSQTHRKQVNSLINQRDAARREARQLNRRLNKAYLVVERLILVSNLKPYQFPQLRN
jgi:butyrate kinase